MESRADRRKLDTVVISAREEGFHRVFLGEHRWYAIRIHRTKLDQIKYVAAYRARPVSAITHIAPVKSIEPLKNTGKFAINFAEPAKVIGPIRLLKGGRVTALQSLRYTTRSRLESARTLDNVW